MLNINMYVAVSRVHTKLCFLKDVKKVLQAKAYFRFNLFSVFCDLVDVIVNYGITFFEHAWSAYSTNIVADLHRLICYHMDIYPIDCLCKQARR